MKASWVPATDVSDWPLACLPYGVAATHGPVVRIGDHALALSDLADRGHLDAALADARECFRSTALNGFMSAGPRAWEAVRARLIELLADGSSARDELAPLLLEVRHLRLELPFVVGDYIDFYSSREHATNLGRLFRPGGEPLMPNWRHLPVGYHGRCGTIVVSGTPVARPRGQRKDAGEERPSFGPSRRLDFELEVGFVVGAGSRLGQPVTADRAGQHLFGVVLLNDWSARDLQAWEYQPLGPFLGKSFATSISPWVVPLAALDEVRVHGPLQEPPVLDYLRVAEPWAFDVELEAALRTDAMAGRGEEYATISRTNLRAVYWNAAQQIAHATVNGASLRTGDLHASGTVSGAASDSYGSLIELAWAGERPLTVGGERRVFLEDGDSVVLRARANPPGRPGFSLGEVEGTIASPIDS
jgi:fumarylacetoacetase